MTILEEKNMRTYLKSENFSSVIVDGLITEAKTSKMDFDEMELFLNNRENLSTYIDFLKNDLDGEISKSMIDEERICFLTKMVVSLDKRRLNIFEKEMKKYGYDGI